MDRISNLSDDLLLKIVSSLPTKTVVSTTLLSKRWRFLWTMVPKLEFNDRSVLEPSKYERFRKYVDKSMALNRAPVLEALSFDVDLCCSAEDIATWVRIGMVHDVRELQIARCKDDGEEHTPLKLPKSLYTYEKLEVLKLIYTVAVDVPVDVCFPSLKTLHLVCVVYETEESHVRLLSGCPVLEELVLDKTRNSYFMRSYFVEMPNLQRLSILDTCDTINFGELGIHKVVINVPSVKYLNFVDFFGDECECENMPEVVEANVKVVYESPEMLLTSLPSVKRLRLCLLASMLQHHIVFHHLVYLELCTDCGGWWDLLTWMLQSSPKLQVLKIGNCDERPCVGMPTEGHWRGPSSVPECLMLHLHTFKWENYNKKEEDKKIMAYILNSARQLKIVDISPCKYYWSVKKKDQSKKLSELVSLPRASELMPFCNLRSSMSWFLCLRTLPSFFHLLQCRFVVLKVDAFTGIDYLKILDEQIYNVSFSNTSV